MSGDKWEIAYTLKHNQWNAYGVDIYTIDVLPDGRIATLLYIYKDSKILIDVRLVIVDTDGEALSFDKSIADYGFDTRQEAALAVHDNTILIAQAKKLEGGKYEVRVVAVDMDSLSHKSIFQGAVDAEYAWSLVVRKAATPKSYVAVALVGGGNYTITAYGPGGKAAYTTVKIPGKWEVVDSARRVLLTNTDRFYSAIMIKNQSGMILYLVGDMALSRVWEAPSIWGGTVAYITTWSNDTTYRGGCFNNDTNFRRCLIFFWIVLGPGQHPWKRGTGVILLTRDTLAGICLAKHPESPANFTLTPTPLIKNNVACVQFNNPPFLDDINTSFTGPCLRWDKMAETHVTAPICFWEIYAPAGSCTFTTTTASLTPATGMGRWGGTASYTLSAVRRSWASSTPATA